MDVAVLKPADSASRYAGTLGDDLCRQVEKLPPGLQLTANSSA